MDEDTAVQERTLPMVTRALNFRAETFDEADNSVEVVFTTGARGGRWDWTRYEMIDEELATEQGNVRLERLNSGAPVLNTHSSRTLADQIGVVVDGSARMEGGLGIARLRFSQREDIAPIVADIRAGIIRNISVGYVVHSYEITENQGQRALYRAVDWEPYEISFVPMPFDAGAQTRSEDRAQGAYPCIIRRATPAIQETTMEEEIQTGAGNDPAQRGASPATQPAPAAAGSQPAQERSIAVSRITTAARNAGIDADGILELCQRHDETPFTETTLMAEIGRRFAERDTKATTISRVPAQASSGVTMRAAMEEALVHRMVPSAPLGNDARQFRGLSLLELARDHISTTGVDIRGMARLEIAERSLHTGSDFPNLIASALNRRLRMAYEENMPSYRMWARRAPNAPDFKSIDVVQMSAMPDLLKVNEAGEFKYGTASDGKVSYSISTYGRIVGVTRQTIVNDDLRALDRIVTGFAGSAARLENRTVYALLTANGNMPDGVALFHASHGNLAGTGAALSETTLGAGRTAMRVQKGLQSEELNLTPRYLIVPAALEQKAYQYTSNNFVPATATAVNEFRAGGRTAVEPIVEAVLDGNSATAFYLAADTGACDTIEYCFLDGAEGVQMSDRIGFNVDGVEIKASLDFAAAVIDHRGLYKNAGA